MNLKNELTNAIKESKNALTLNEIIDRIVTNQGQYRMNSKTKKRIKLILTKQSKKSDGFVIKKDDGRFISRKKVEMRLRNKIVKAIKDQGFEINDKNTISKPKMESKESIRKLHYYACKDKYLKSKKFLKKNENELIQFFAEGCEIDIDNFKATIQVVEPETVENNLFRYATLLWSVPVSQGFGRRVRFLVWDENIGKLVGLFAVGDPVLNLTARDDWVGWDYVAKMERLYNVMDIFVLGSVPPYNRLLGGKLTALAATSNEVREYIKNRYQNTKTIIKEEVRDSRLALLTTSSALGKSSLYDRITYNGRTIYNQIGHSKGWGHFHLNHGLFEEMRRYVSWTKPSKASTYHFGQGPNWKIRTARECLVSLGLPGSLLQHGIKREIYTIPLASNFDEFLCGKTDNLDYYDMAFSSLSEYWKERWLIGRVKRKPEYKNISRKDVQKMIHG